MHHKVNSNLAAKMAEVMHNAGHDAGFFSYPYSKVQAHGVEKYGVLAKAILQMPEFGLSALSPQPMPPLASEGDELLRDMRCRVIWTDVATMPIPLYERIKAFIASTLTNESVREKESRYFNQIINRASTPSLIDRKAAEKLIELQSENERLKADLTYALATLRASTPPSKAVMGEVAVAARDALKALRLAEQNYTADRFESALIAAGIIQGA